MLASALPQQTALIPAAVSWLGCSPPRGLTSMRDMCVSLSLITPIHQLAKCAPLVSPVGPNKKKKIEESHLSLIHPCILRPSYFLPQLPSPQAVCLSPRQGFHSAVFCPKPLASPLGAMRRKGLGFISLSRPDTNHKGREFNDGIS